MSFRTITTRRHVLEIDDIEVDLEFEPVRDPLTKRIGNKLVVAYNVQDSDPQNPLEDCDCYGEIHHHPRSRYRGSGDRYYEILGLDSYGDAVIDQDKLQNKWVEYLEATLTGKLPEDLLQRLIEEEVEDVPLRTHCKYAWIHNSKQGDRDLSDDEFEQYVDIVEGNVLWDYEAEAEDCREEGDPDAVMLDMYEHSGVIWSVAGTGMSCWWDTSRGESVWIPSDEQRNYLNEITDPDKRQEYLIEAAKSACEAYTAYCMGWVYGCVVEVFELKDDEWVQVEEDACWGYYGDDAEEQLEAEYFNPAVKQLESEQTN